MNQNLLLLLFILLSQTIIAQKNSLKILDSLKNKSYQYLDNKAYELKKDSARAAVYLYAYLYKAKKEQNWKEIANGYKNLSHHYPDKLSLIYTDSLVYAAKRSHDNATIGSAYLSKGIAYYWLKQHNKALDNYILANQYIAKTHDQYLIHKLKYNIAMVKYYLGYYDEAISLLKQCISYFKNENPQPYLKSLHFLGQCYNRIGNYGLCSETNNLGLKECRKLDTGEMEVYFIHSQGINEYFKKNYSLAIENIASTLEELKKNNDFANESVGYFYIGKSYWETKKYQKALPYFEKVDQFFNKKGYLRPDLREVYELLIDYYKTEDNPKLQLYYVDQLLRADTMLNETFKYLVGKINKEYNTQKLLLEKDNLRDQLARKSYRHSVLIGITSLLFSGFLIVVYHNFRNRKLYRHKFDELMEEINNSKNRSKLRDKNEKPTMPDIHPQTVSDILKQLEKFEKEKRYLDKDWKLSKLATFFNSNPTYLSAIIHHYKDKRFNDYINDLKIDYIIYLFYTEKLVRNYTNKALAEEAGFSTTELFAKAFKAKTGMPTVYFIERVKKEGLDTNSLI